MFLGELLLTSCWEATSCSKAVLKVCCAAHAAGSMLLCSLWWQAVLLNGGPMCPCIYLGLKSKNSLPNTLHKNLQSPFSSLQAWENISPTGDNKIADCVPQHTGQEWWWPSSLWAGKLKQGRLHSCFHFPLSLACCMTVNWILLFSNNFCVISVYVHKCSVCKLHTSAGYVRVGN